jgi:DNA-binding CsgD family transcriptional regulator
MLADNSLSYLILDISCDPNWLQVQANVQARRPDIRRVVLGLLQPNTMVSARKGPGFVRPGLVRSEGATPRAGHAALVPGDELILRCLEEGARAYLEVDAGPLAVRQAVEAVIEGLIWAPRRVLSILIDRLMSRQVEVAAVRLKPPSFSPRERQVLDLIMAASSNREIAEELGIEERTVKAYVASLMRKTGVDNRVTLSVQATQESMRKQYASQA